MSDVFLELISDEAQPRPPIFIHENVIFCHITVSGLHFVFTTKHNVSANLMMEMLHRISRIFKDYCGTLSEDSVRKNFILIYELLDEALDFGYPQAMSTELLKSFIYNEPVTGEGVTEKTIRSLMPIAIKITDKKTLPSAQANRPVAVGAEAARSKENTIFVDVYERLSVAMTRDGQIIHSAVDGSIQLRNFMSTVTELRLSLNENLVVNSQDSTNRYRGGYGGAGSGGAVMALDDVNYHECIRGTNFQPDNSLLFEPPEGEFTLMNYRISSHFRPPIIILPIVEELTSYGVLIPLRLFLRCGCVMSCIAVFHIFPDYPVPPLTHEL